LGEVGYMNHMTLGSIKNQILVDIIESCFNRDHS